MFAFWKKDARAKLDALDCSQAVIEFRLDGTILTANANFLAVMGYALAEIHRISPERGIGPARRRNVRMRFAG